MRNLLILVLPGLLNGCVALPFFLDPNVGTDPVDPFDPVDPNDTGSIDDPDDPYQRTFRPYAAFISLQATQSEEDGFTGHYLFPDDANSWQEPYISIMFVEEEYFDNYNGQFSCTWTGNVTEAVEGPLGVPDEWFGYVIGVELVETDCQNFDPNEWGDTTPTLRIEALELGVAYAPMSSEMTNQFQQAIQSWGEDWSEYQPYIFSTWFGFKDAFGAWENLEADFTFAYELHPEGGMVYGPNGDNVKVDVTSGEAPMGLYGSQAWRGFYAWMISAP